LLDVQPVKRWIEEFSVELRLRDEIEREALEWQNAESRLATARRQRQNSKQLEALQKDIVAAIAARRGPRLKAAMGLVSNPAFARLLGRKERDYLDACLAHETEQTAKQHRILGRAIMSPALQALEGSLSEHALRLVAAVALLADDLDLQLIPDLWRVAARAIFQCNTQAVLKGHTGVVLSATFSPDGTRVATASDDGTARLWDAQTGEQTAVLHAHAGAVRSATFSPDSTRVATASDDGTARLWDAQTGEQTAVLRAHASAVRSATFSPDNTRLVTASDDHTARLWDEQSGKEIAVLRHAGAVLSVTFSPDGTRVATASEDGTARLWDAQTGKEMAVRRAHASAVSSVTFSPDGTQLVTASDDHTARLSDAQSGKEIAVLPHADAVLSAQFSPDCKGVVTASKDGTARLWDAQTGERTAVLRGHAGVVTSAMFSFDGTRVVTASELDFVHFTACSRRLL
jgi:WD40 repeat protein